MMSAKNMMMESQKQVRGQFGEEHGEKQGREMTESQDDAENATNLNDSRY